MSCIIIADCNITEDSPGVLCPVALTTSINKKIKEMKMKMKNNNQKLKEKKKKRDIK